MNEDRLGRVEKIIEGVAARQQYHEEALDRLDEAGPHTPLGYDGWSAL